MKIAPLAVAVAAGLLVAPAAASAGGYVGLGIGSATTGDELDENYDGDGSSIRITIGQRFTWVSLEAGLNTYGLKTENSRATWDAKALSAAGRVHMPLTGKLEGYLRLGVERHYVDRSDNEVSLRGSGWLASLGAEYGLHFGFAKGSVWLDLTRHNAMLTNTNSGNQLDANIDTVSVGLSVGF
jgi:hypothetical protein